MSGTRLRSPVVLLDEPEQARRWLLSPTRVGEKEGTDKTMRVMVFAKVSEDSKWTGPPRPSSSNLRRPALNPVPEVPLSKSASVGPLPANSGPLVSNRWDVDRCSRLLEDIRAVADADRLRHISVSNVPSSL
jgi:hypothetical protein